LNSPGGYVVSIFPQDSGHYRAKIQQLEDSTDLLDKETAKELLNKWKAGKLKGRVYHTDIVDGVVDRTRTVDFDYGTEPPW